MKKILFAIATIALVALAACENKPAEQQPAAINTDSIATSWLDTIKEKLAAGDTAAVEGILADAQKQVQDLLAAGDTVNANALAEKFAEQVEANKEALPATLVETVKTKATEIKDAAAGKVAEAVEGAKDAVEGAADEAKAAVDEKVEEVKGKAAEAADGAKEAAAKKADEVKGKAADAAAGAVDDAKKKLGL